MSEFGGMGGIKEGRPLDVSNPFELAVEKTLGERIRQDKKIAIDMWSALANVDWKHANGDTASYSFRAAGDLVAAIRGSGNYMDWYCSGSYACVAEVITDALAEEGWRVSATFV